MTVSVNTPDRNRTGLKITVVVAVALATALIVARFGGPDLVVVGALLISVPLVWFRSIRANVAAYVASLSVQLPEAYGALRLLGPFRFAVSDLFMAPVLCFSAFEAWRRRESLPPSTLTRPFGLMLVAFLVATVVGYYETGRLTRYVLINRDGGILILIAGFFAMRRVVQTPAQMMTLVRWFIFGVSVTNIASFAAVALALAGFENTVFSPTNLRLYGWVGSPNLYGGILMTAGMIELGLLVSVSPPARAPLLRWLNLWLLALGAALTLSRSAWLAIAVAAWGLLVWLVLEHFRGERRRLSHFLAVGVWALLPSLALASILNANLRVGLPSWAERAMAMRSWSDSQPTSAFAVEEDVLPPASPEVPTEAAGAAAPVRARPKEAPVRARPEEAPAPAVVTPSAPVDLQRSVQSALSLQGTVMNARGLQDRGAILGLAWDDYTATTRGMILGIGLGTFLATSSVQFGIPLIIHNSIAWFLVELGPLGLIAFVWVWGQTGINLWIAARQVGGRRALATGLIGAYVGTTAFWIANEGFYQRHFWLILLLADCMRWMPTWESEARPDSALGVGAS